jgi:succinate dehydrogenase / fumarate reductase cytochrome b subunit
MDFHWLNRARARVRARARKNPESFALASIAGYNRRGKTKGAVLVVAKKKPKNLNLFTLRLPLPAIVSILHRFSGVILFFFAPFFLWGLQLSLASAESFNYLHSILTCPGCKFLLWGSLSALIYHLIAGIRHLFMDIGIGEELNSGRLSAKWAMGVSIVFIVLTGFWLW